MGLNNLNASQKVSITRDSNKSQQFIPDTNSTLDYTAVWVSSNIGGPLNITTNNKGVLESVTNPTTTKHSPHDIYIRKQKKSRESQYGISGSQKSSNGSKSMNPSKPSMAGEWVINNTINSNWSRFGSSSNSNPSNNDGSRNSKFKRSINKSEEKHLESTQREVKAKFLIDEQFRLITTHGANVSIFVWTNNLNVILN